MTENTKPILFHFAPWADAECWVLSNKNKQPCTIHAGKYLSEPQKEYAIGDMLRWKEEPQDHISTLPKILKTKEMLPGYGFGIILNLNNHLACFDFDNALDDNGEIINRNVQEFIEVAGSFTEISSSGKGLHVFVCLDLPEQTVVNEFGFKKSHGDGKFYNARFIKMTGNCPDDFDIPVRVINLREFNGAKKQISNERMLSISNKISKPIDGNITTNWDEILSEVGIFHIRSQYFGKSKNYPDGSCKTAVESYKIPCPNRYAHTNLSRRLNQFGPDAAILTRWDDGSSSCTCNHNNCSPENRPNLLQKLWDEINSMRLKDADTTLSDYKEVLS